MELREIRWNFDVKMGNSIRRPSERGNGFQHLTNLGGKRASDLVIFILKLTNSPNRDNSDISEGSEICGLGI